MLDAERKESGYGRKMGVVEGEEGGGEEEGLYMMPCLALFLEDCNLHHILDYIPFFL